HEERFSGRARGLCKPAVVHGKEHKRHKGHKRLFLCPLCFLCSFPYSLSGESRDQRGGHWTANACNIVVAGGCATDRTAVAVRSTSDIEIVRGTRRPIHRDISVAQG